MKDVNISDTSPIYCQNATALAALIRTKQLSSREVVQAHLDRVSAVNPSINAVVTLIAEQALKAAGAADTAVASGAQLGPLHGVAFSIKDSLDTAGVPTQRGSKLFADNIPDEGATAVRRFKAAGGILLMKTNLPEFSFWTETDNLVTGRTNNPWNLERTPGGSSGGESAALAAGMSPIGIGSDVMSDVGLGHAILKGPDAIDGYAIHARDAEADIARIAGQPIRVGWVSDAAFGPVDPEITTAVTAAAVQLAGLGCEVEEVSLPFLGNPFGTLGTLAYGEIVPSIKTLAAGRESELHAVGAGTIKLSDPGFVDFAAAHAEAETLRSAFAGFFEKYDVLLTPVNPMTATPHGAQEVVVNGVKVSWTHVMAATSPLNLTGLPALSVPYGFSSENLPIGIQLIAKWLDEATILRLGALLERRGGLGNRRPLI